MIITFKINITILDPFDMKQRSMPISNILTVNFSSLITIVKNILQYASTGVIKSFDYSVCKSMYV